MQRLLARLTLLGITFALAAGSARAAEPPPGGVPGVLVPQLSWSACHDGFECATATVPKDYKDPGAGTVDLPVIRKAATDTSQRIGSLFLNPGGPGGSGVGFLAAAAGDFADLNARFDLVSWDPRGVGASAPAIRCLTDAEADARNARPFTTPQNLRTGDWVSDAALYDARCVARNPGTLPYVGTGSTARDLDLLRAAVGDAKLNYLGYSYGTALGATYASLFPGRARALVLDGAVDRRSYFTDPLSGSYDQTASMERELGRFFARCAAQQAVCGFGGSDPRGAFDQLVAQLQATPLVATDGRPVTGDTARLAAILAMYSPDLWPLLANGSKLAQHGVGDLLQILADAALGRDANGHYDGSADQFFAIQGVDGAWPKNPSIYDREGRRAAPDFPHFFFNHGFTELGWGLYPVRGHGLFRGPFSNPPAAAPALVVGTTFDPATPYAEAQKLTQELGNARLLSMDGDGHTASYAGNSPCIDGAVTAYLVALALPPEGTVCQQVKDPFPAAAAAPQALVSSGAATAAWRAAVRRAVAQVDDRMPVAVARTTGVGG
jgi:pimeloyl-ACP methyl ester carboxylesterase